VALIRGREKKRKNTTQKQQKGRRQDIEKMRGPLKNKVLSRESEKQGQGERCGAILHYSL